VRRRLFWTGVACALLVLAALSILLGAAGRFTNPQTGGEVR